MADGPTLQIPRDVIEPIIQAQIAASITAALGANQILEKAIQTILQVRVNGEGKVDTYNDRNSRPWVEWAVADALRKAATTAINEAVAQQQEAIRKEIAAQLSRKNSPLVKQMVESLMVGVFKSENLKYRLSVSVD